jgi:trimethylamine--corrinoid protein Co-methyltransferase
MERGLRHRVLTASDVADLHEAALAALATGGVPVAGETALALLGEAGAEVDRAAGRVRLPVGLVRGAVARAPAAFLLPGRAPGRGARFGGGPGGLLAAMAAASDIAAACRLADALPEVAAVGLPTRRLSELATAVESTTKPVLICGAMSVAHAATVTAAAAALAGAIGQAARGDVAAGAGEAARRPPLGVVVHSADQVDLDPLLACARAGLACGWLTQPLVAGEAAAPSGPVALHAAALAACALQQLAAPGSPYFVPALPAAIGLHAPGCGAGPAAVAVFCTLSQLAGHAGLPITTGLPPDRPSSDEWRAAADGVLAACGAALGGAALVAGAGHTDGGTCYTAAQLVLDAEAWSNVAAVAAGIVVDDETIALETIEAVGIGGNALGQKHTRRHMKDIWRPRLFDRTTYDVWDREGRQSGPQRAAAMAGDLVAGHDVPPLDAEKRATLRRIIATAGL